ncbi:hypothetical protein [Exiguobacterium sp. 8A]|uniref:hypothetical protein n=1 Tax=Exiguobacterium sp. 8A TaxID=2653139 RepID=UPI00135C7ABB|nr:hypothetical protein [Exiguobacterium sp. 8A]
MSHHPHATRVTVSVSLVRADGGKVASPASPTNPSPTGAHRGHRARSARPRPVAPARSDGDRGNGRPVGASCRPRPSGTTVSGRTDDVVAPVASCDERRVREATVPHQVRGWRWRAVQVKDIRKACA